MKNFLSILLLSCTLCGSLVAQSDTTLNQRVYINSERADKIAGPINYDTAVVVVVFMAQVDSVISLRLAHNALMQEALDSRDTVQIRACYEHVRHDYAKPRESSLVWESGDAISIPVSPLECRGSALCVARLTYNGALRTQSDNLFYQICRQLGIR